MFCGSFTHAPHMWSYVGRMCLHWTNKKTSFFFTTWRNLRAFSLLHANCWFTYYTCILLKYFQNPLLSSGLLRLTFFDCFFRTELVCSDLQSTHSFLFPEAASIRCSQFSWYVYLGTTVTFFFLFFFSFQFAFSLSSMPEALKSRKYICSDTFSQIVNKNTDGIC